MVASLLRSFAFGSGPPGRSRRDDRGMLHVRAEVCGRGAVLDIQIHRGGPTMAASRVPARSGLQYERNKHGPAIAVRGATVGGPCRPGRLRRLPDAHRPAGAACRRCSRVPAVARSAVVVASIASSGHGLVPDDRKGGQQDAGLARVRRRHAADCESTRKAKPSSATSTTGLEQL
jgi:hypothetical protein